MGIRYQAIDVNLEVVEFRIPALGIPQIEKFGNPVKLHDDCVVVDQTYVEGVAGVPLHPLLQPLSFRFHVPHGSTTPHPEHRNQIRALGLLPYCPATLNEPSPGCPHRPSTEARWWSDPKTVPSIQIPTAVPFYFR